MSEHDFYADPTVFDHWAKQSRSWLVDHLGRLQPYAWTLGFAAMSVIFLAVSVAVLAVSLGASALEAGPAWNELLARCCTFVMSMVAGQYLLRQALIAWPEYIAMSPVLRILCKAVGGTRPVVKRPVIDGKPVERRKASPEERARVQLFFSGVRAAGVNVSIARALFNAGIRSTEQLLNARDEQLHAIHGVGPATVRKLRAHFK